MMMSDEIKGRVARDGRPGEAFSAVCFFGVCFLLHVFWLQAMKLLPARAA